MTDQEKIKQEAKKIMDDFMKALDRVPEIKEEFGTFRKETTRKPTKSKYGKEFADRMLKNAPKVEDNCIVAEKKKW